MTLRFLHLEDNGDDVELVRTTLTREGFDCEILAVDSGAAYRAALQHSHFDAVLSDSTVLGYDGSEALSDARERFPGIPFIVVSAAADVVDEEPSNGERRVTARVPKSELHRLAATLREALPHGSSAPNPTSTTTNAAIERMQQLVSVVQRLSL